MKQIILLTFGIIVLVSAKCYGQSDFRDGYIITKNNDTVYGRIDYRSNTKNYKSCIFRKDKEIKKYTINELNGFGYLNDKYFTSKIIDSTFVEVLVEGEISLYKLNSIYLMRKNEGEIFKLEQKDVSLFVEGVEKIREDNRWKGIISFLISDCLNDYNDIVKRLTFNERDLTNIVVKYNICRNSNFREIKKSRPWSKFDFGATVGIILSSISLHDIANNYYYMNKSYRSFIPTLGLSLAISSPRIFDKIAIQPEIYISKPSYSSFNKFEKFIVTEYYDAQMNLTTISIPISLKYSLLKKNYRFYALGGINFDYNLKVKTTLQSEVEYYNIVNSFYKTPFLETQRKQFGYFGGIGITKLFKKFALSADFRYYQISDLNTNTDLTIKANKIAFTLTISKK